jgi:subtilisin family serine protease
MTMEMVLEAPVHEKASDPVREIALYDSFRGRGMFIPRREGSARRRGTSSIAAALRSGMTYAEPPLRAAAALSKYGFQPAFAGLHEREHAAGIFEELGMLGVTVAAFRDPIEAGKAAAELQEDYDFVPDFALRLPDPQLRAQTRIAGKEASEKLLATEWPEESGIQQARDNGNDGGGVLVGALDTGVDAGHDEFAGKPINFRYVSFYPKNRHYPSRDVFGFDTDLHGTHVSGIIAGKTRGIAPGVKLYVASVIESETTLTSLTRVAEGLNWLLGRFSEGGNQELPAVINMSLGMPAAAPGDISRAEYETRIRAMRYVIQDLLEANVLSVAAIGNSGEDTFGYPGAFGETLGVGAVDFTHQVAAFSGNRRPIAGPIEAEKPDLVGYGVGVFSCLERDCDGQSYYDIMDGTSMAAPYVTGISALYRSAMPQANAAEIRRIVLETCLPLPDQPAYRVGAGLARYDPQVGIV